MFYDVVMIITPEMVEKHAEYTGLDGAVLATCYVPELAHLIANYFDLLSNGINHVVIERIGAENTSPYKLGVFSE